MPRRKRPAPQASVVRILEAADPIEELHRYLVRGRGIASIQAGQLVLGAAQLLLPSLPRGGNDVKRLLDLVLWYWDALPDPSGFHVREFMTAAFLAVGDDPDRIAKLVTAVPDQPDAELLTAVTAAFAIAGFTGAMLQTLRAAIASGASPAAFRRGEDFARYHADPDFVAQLELGERVAAAARSVAPHLPRVRAMLDDVIAALTDFDAIVTLNEPATLEDILAAERACQITLPDDYRALLMLHDGLRLWDEAFLGTLDYTSATDLAARAADYLETCTRDGSDALVPLASRGARTWLLYDPRGAYRRGPGYVIRAETSSTPAASLVELLGGIVHSAHEMTSKLN